MGQLLKEDESDYEIVKRSKFDRSVRAGCHFSPRLLVEWAGVFAELEEYYWKYVAQHDYLTCFSTVLSRPGSLERNAGRLIHPGNYKEWNKAILQKGKEHGRWIGKLDIENFYRSVSSEILMCEAGRQHLDIPPCLIDRITMLMQLFGKGLPIGSITSDLIARLVLYRLDDECLQQDIPVIRWVDDMLVFGESREEVRHYVIRVIEILHRIGFHYNWNKFTLEHPDRFAWIVNGITWQQVPVENYPILPRDPAIDTDIDPGSSHTEYSGSTKFDVDRDALLRLFYDEFASGMPCRSEPGNRFVLRKMGELLPEILLGESEALILDRASNATYIPQGFSEDLRSRALATTFRSLVRARSHEDDRLRTAETSTGIARDELARYFSRIGQMPITRAVRQGLLQILPKSDADVETALKISSSDPWVDEDAALAEFIISGDSPTFRIARRLLTRQSRRMGLLMEVFQN